MYSTIGCKVEGRLELKQLLTTEQVLSFCVMGERSGDDNSKTIDNLKKLYKLIW